MSSNAASPMDTTPDVYPTSVSMTQNPSAETTTSNSTAATENTTQPTTPLTTNHGPIPQIYTTQQSQQVHLPPIQVQMSPLESCPVFPTSSAYQNHQPQHHYTHHYQGYPSSFTSQSATSSYQSAQQQQTQQGGSYPSNGGWLAPAAVPPYSQASYASQNFPPTYFASPTPAGAPPPFNFYVPSSYGSSHQHQSRPSYIQLPPNSMQNMVPAGQGSSNTMTSAYSLHTPYTSRPQHALSPADVQSVSVHSAAASPYPSGLYPPSAPSQGIRNEGHDPRAISGKASGNAPYNSGRAYATLQAPRQFHYAGTQPATARSDQHESPEMSHSSKSTTSCPASPFRPGVDEAHTPVLFSAAPRSAAEANLYRQQQQASRAPHAQGFQRLSVHGSCTSDSEGARVPFVGPYAVNVPASNTVASMDAILPRRPAQGVKLTPPPPPRRTQSGVDIWSGRRASREEADPEYEPSPSPLREVKPIALRRSRRVAAVAAKARSPRPYPVSPVQSPIALKPKAKRRAPVKVSDPDIYAAVIAATTTRIPGPIPIPSLTKKHRGRAVAKDPKRIDANVVHVCPIDSCGACFKRKEHVKRHVRGIHSVDKVSQSDVCADYSR